jgi:hypothetical protein
MNCPNYDQNAIVRLSERTEYEAWLLEAVYTITEQELFSKFPDAVIYPSGSSQPESIRYGRGNILIGDWRPGFLNAGAPLIFITTFKVLDMFVEWVLSENGLTATFRFQEKMNALKRAPTFPAFIETRRWLKERLIGLYSKLEPLRGTIIHSKHFTVSDGAINVSSSKNNVVGTPFHISREELRTLAVFSLSVLRYADGTWSLNEFREKVLRHALDNLANFHGFPLLGQLQPYYPTVRVFSLNENPRSVDLVAICNDLAKQNPNNDCLFDLRVLTVREGAVVDAFLFPWPIIQNGWSGSVNPETYRVAIPQDIDSKHLSVPPAG